MTTRFHSNDAEWLSGIAAGKEPTFWAIHYLCCLVREGDVVHIDDQEAREAMARAFFGHLSDDDWHRLLTEYGAVKMGPGLARAAGLTPDQTAIGIDPAFFDDGEAA